MYGVCTDKWIYHNRGNLESSGILGERNKPGKRREREGSIVLGCIHSELLLMQLQKKKRDVICDRRTGGGDGFCATHISTLARFRLVTLVPHTELWTNML